MTAYEEICAKVGMICYGEDVAKAAVIELLPLIGLKESYAVKYPEQTAQEIKDYLDDVARNP